MAAALMTSGTAAAPVAAARRAVARRGARQPDARLGAPAAARPALRASRASAGRAAPRRVACRAEAPSDGAAAAMSSSPPPKGAQGAKGFQLRLASYFSLWYACNVVFNLYNKSALNVFPYPWLMCTVQLGCGVVMMLALWATGIVKAPKVDLKFIKALLPVAAFHLVNHVGVCFALSKSAVGFTHVLKAAEPFYSVTISALLGTFYSPLVYASLVPIVAGISLAVVTELNFSMQAFIATNAANVSTVVRTIISKRMLKDYDIKGINLYAWISIVALAQLVPLAVMIEGHKWQAGWQAGVAAVGVPQLLHLVLASGVLYHLYNQLSYQTLDSVSPVSFSIANALKRVAIIGSAVLFFGTPMTPLNAFGSALAILGTYLYSRAKLL